MQKNSGSSRSTPLSRKVLAFTALSPSVIVMVIGILLPTQSAEAKVFRNAYVSFELPDKWECSLQQTEWVCRTTNPATDKREAIIVLTAKEVGPSDSIPAYEEHLRKPRTIMGRSGQALNSQILKVETRKIGGFPWADGFHLASEVPNYYTRYLATTKDNIAVLVTFSAYKTVFTKYSADFFRAIESLRVIATRSLMDSGKGGMAGGAGGTLGGPLGGAGLGADQGPLPDERDSGKSGSGPIVLGFAVIFLAVVVYIFLKKRQNDD